MKTGKIKHAMHGLIFLVFTTIKITAQFIPIATTLPVTKETGRSIDLKFKATIEENNGRINWVSSKQLKVRRYELEKSSDGENFNYITAIAGNIASVSNYSVQDKNLSDARNYYRLKIVAANGTKHYSKIISLDAVAKQEEIKILPTQLNQKIFIWMPTNISISNASISDASGRNILQHTLITNATNLADVEISRLPIGLYNIELLTNKGETVKLKFSKGS